MLSAGDLGQGQETPEDIGADQGPDCGVNQGAEGSLHEVGQHTGDKDKEEWYRCQEKSGAGDVGMGYTKDDEECSDQQWSGIAEIASARPDGIGYEGS